MRPAARALALLVTALLAAPAGASAAERFDARGVRMPAGDARYLERIFALTDAAAEENEAVLRWFASGGEHGLHAADHALRVAELSRRMAALDTPPHLQSWVERVAHAIAEQGRFFADWSRALDAGRPFDSQLVSEYGYHEGLHRSQRDLISAYDRLLDRYGAEGERTRRAMRAHLGALDLLAPRARP